MHQSSYYFPPGGLDIRYHLNKVIECVDVDAVPYIGSLEAINEYLQPVKDDLKHEDSPMQAFYQHILDPIEYVIPKLGEYIRARRNNEATKIDKQTALIFAERLDSGVHDLMKHLDEQE